MRILYNATSARVGGGLSYSLNQLRALADRDDVTLTVLVSPWNREALAAELPPGTAVRSVRVPNAALRFVWEQTVLPALAGRHDVLVSPGNFGALVCPVPQVVVLQNPNYVGRGRRLPQNSGWRRRAKIAVSHLSMRRADLVVAISRSLAAEMRREPGLRGIRTATVTSGAPAPADPAPPGGGAEPTPSDDPPYVLSVANDYPHKRLDDLARLARRAADVAAAPSRVVLAGDVPPARRDHMRSLAGPAADDLVFLGPVADRAEVLGLYRRAAVAVSTSELEAWPLTLHEARSQGAPLVVSDIPPHRELAEGQAAFVPVGDVDALLEAVVDATAAPRPGPWSLDRSWSDHAEELVERLHELVTPPGSAATRRVALFQPVLPHYRVPLFTALQEAVGGGLVLFSAAGRTPSGVEDAGAASTVPRVSAPTRRLGPLWCVPRALREVGSRRWDVVVLSWNVRQVEILPALLLARARRVPVVLWGHGLGTRRSRPSLWLRRLQARLASAVLTYGEGGRTEVEELAPGATVRTMLNTSARPAPSDDAALAEPAGALAYLGRLDARKQVDRLLAALALVEPDLTLEVVGDGPERHRLEAEAIRLGLADRVRWHGQVTDWEAVVAVLRTCDLVVQPAAAGLTVVDAFAAARGAVIPASDPLNGPEAELVEDGLTGHRYLPPTAEGLARCLAEATSRPDELREVSRRAGAVYRERLSAEAAATAFVSVLREVTDPRRS